jgi:hypothetical protein
MRPTRILACLLLASLPAAEAFAADAYIGVYPNRGEMVVMRDVNARHAYRQVPPSIALIADPKPNREINATLGTGEMSDDEISGLLSAGPSGGPVPFATAATERALQGSLGRVGGEGMLSGGSISGRVGGVTGAVTGATRGIAPTISGALSQFPVGGNQGTGP